jgi:hypothetical protein
MLQAVMLRRHKSDRVRTTPATAPPASPAPSASTSTAASAAAATTTPPATRAIVSLPPKTMKTHVIPFATASERKFYDLLWAHLKGEFKHLLK